MQAVKHILKYICVFFGVILFLTGILVLSALIPKSSIKTGVQESAEYFCERDVYYQAVDGVRGSMIDHYADSILLSIAYQYDAEDPLHSVMWSSYYSDKNHSVIDNLLLSVTNDYEANQQYMRYWHGSIAIVRPLLTIFNVKQIYILNGVILAGLVIWLLAVLFKNRSYAPAIGVLAGLVMTSVWYVPFSLEYTWTYLLMLLMSVIGIKLALKERWDMLGIFFLIGGIVTNYLDFLTTETLTLTVPLLLVLWVYRSRNENESLRHIAAKACKPALAWGAGYAGMWVMKWIMASVVLQMNVMPYVSEHIGERIGGDLGLNLWQYIYGAVRNNLKCLFPFEYGPVGLIGGLVIVLFTVYIGYVYHKKHINKSNILIPAIIGIVPYIRYIVLHNHSYLHYFFTYRAQLATILAVVLILEEMTEPNRSSHRKIKK